MQKAVVFLALVLAVGMVTAQCPSSCPGGGSVVCARDYSSTSGNGGYQEFSNYCEFERHNCNNGNRFTFISYGVCNAGK